MAKFPTVAAALKPLLDANNGLAAANFDVLSGVTASADELNLLDGLSVAGNATASKAVVLDADKALLGLRRAVTVDADGMTGISEAYSGGVFTNEGAAGKYLSADAVGEWVRLLCVKAGQWQVAGYAGTWTAEG